MSGRSRASDAMATVASGGFVVVGGSLILAGGILAALAVLALAAALIFAGPLLGAFVPSLVTTNTAKVAARPIVDSMKSAGATTFCELGDPGVGPDNLLPWYDGYFVASDPDQVQKAVFSAAAAHGYSLSPDKGSTSPARTAEAGLFSSNPSGNAYQYNDSPGPAPSLVVSIERRAKVPTNCYGSSGGTRSASPPSGGAVFEISLTGTKPAGHK